MTRESDLQALASYDFADRSEDDVRGDWIEPLLRLLGYGLGTRNRIERGQSLQLQPPFRAVGRQRIQFDFKPTVRGRGLWVIEAKKPVDDLFSDDHLAQMWTYATDPRVNVPLGVLCDGQRLGIFDLTKVEWDVPELDLPQAAIAEQFAEVERVLGARRVAEWVRQRQLHHLRTALEAQLDLSVLDDTVDDLRTMVGEVRPVIEAERHEIAQQAWQEREAERQAAVESGGTWAIAQSLNGPLPPIMRDIDEVVSAVERRDPQVRVRELDNLLEAARVPRSEGDNSPPRMWWALRAVRFAAALRLVADPTCGSHAQSIASQAARDHIMGFPEDELAAAAHRFGLVLGPCIVQDLAHAAGNAVRATSERLVGEMDPEDWLRANAGLGLQPDQLFANVVQLSGRAAFFGVSPWNVGELERRTKEMHERLAQTSMPPNAPRVSMGDPWLRGWLESDPLIEGTRAALRETIQDYDGTVREFAEQLLAEYPDEPAA